jgi:hypothetical protein
VNTTPKPAGIQRRALVNIAKNGGEVFLHRQPTKPPLFTVGDNPNKNRISEEMYLSPLQEGGFLKVHPMTDHEVSLAFTLTRAGADAADELLE